MSFLSPLSSLYHVLQSVCASAEANAALLRKNEAATRAALVDPVLRALGWDTANVEMVEPEKTIGGDLRVDYLLYDASGKPRLVIEAKCLEASLDKHGYVSKVLGYALGFKVQTVFITDGLSWHCYSNWQQGNTEAISVKLERDNLLLAANQLVLWLDAAQSGHGILPATNGLALPNGNEAFAASPKQTMTGKAKNQGKQTKVFVPTADFIDLTQVSLLSLQPGQKPKELRLPNGEVKLIQTWKDILLETCHFVLATNPHLPVPLSDKAGKKRFLIAAEKPIAGSSTAAFYKSKPVFIYTHYSASDCIANALHAAQQIPTIQKSTTLAIRF